MASVRIIVSVLALTALAGCCTPITGCYVATPGVPIAWDGDGPRPVDQAAARKRSVQPGKSATKVARSKAVVSRGPIAEAHGELPPSEMPWAEREAADRDADARLTRQLTICRGCLSPSGDENAGGMARR